MDKFLLVTKFAKMPTPAHIGWLVKLDNKLATADGLTIQLWKLNTKPDPIVLSAWAKHFRNHYCDDNHIDTLRNGTPHSRKDYLLKIKFPDPQTAPGPSIRSGDFSEILIADYVEYVLGYWVPRTRYDDKTVRNESKKGSDIVGFLVKDPSRPQPSDKLLVFESKAQLSGRKASALLQEAIDHSAKDELRNAESLNAIKQRLIDRQEMANAVKVSRFQDLAKNPYQFEYGAAAIYSSHLLDDAVIEASDGTHHPGRTKLSLIVISSTELMDFVHKLYSLAADEADHA